MSTPIVPAPAALAAYVAEQRARLADADSILQTTIRAIGSQCKAEHIRALQVARSLVDETLCALDAENIDGTEWAA